MNDEIFSVEIKKIHMNGVTVEMNDGSEGFIPREEWDYDPESWEKDRTQIKVG